MAEKKIQATNALILGGGGTTGIAWEMGVILGLFDGGVDVTNAGLVIGTSAGATVGAQITSGLALEELYALQLRPLEETKEQVVQFDFAVLAQVFGAGAGAPDIQTAQARVGAAALAAKTMSEAARLEIITARLPVQEWPKEQRLVIPAVDAHTGETVAFDRDAQVPLAQAVTASSAVPGVYPPTSIRGHRYIDGGVRSATNADLAKGYQRVLILQAETLEMVEVEGQPATPRLTFKEELAILREAGGGLFVITPDEESAIARGANALDASRRAVSARAGRAQGRLLAEKVRSFWGN